MNAQEMKELVAEGKFSQLESAWMQAVEESMPLAEMVSVLEALVAAGKLDQAETLGWALLAQRAEQLPPLEALPVARAVIAAVPDSDELRSLGGELYSRAYKEHPELAAILAASGLAEGQSPKRAFRTLELCLAVRPTNYLINRFDQQVIRLTSFDPLENRYQAADPAGRPLSFEPKLLADEFDLVEENDFRVLMQCRPQELTRRLQEDPAAVLVGLCLANGGQISVEELKERLAPRCLRADQWSAWWGRARTAAKRHPQLSLEGRPVVVSYHKEGRTLEQEMEELFQSAKGPLEQLEALRQYVRAGNERGTPPQAQFVGPMVEALAQQARQARQSQVEALAAALALEEAARLALPAPAAPFPSAREVLADTDDPAGALADLSDPSLWPAAVEALAARPDAAAKFAQLLHQAEAPHLDLIAQRLADLGEGEALAQAVAAAGAEPIGHLELALWLWKGPAVTLPNPPSRLKLLSRLLGACDEVHRDRELPAPARKNFCHRVRSAFSANNYAGFRAALAEMDTAVAGTVKRLVEFNDGLAEAVRGQMMDLLRENFYSLFVKDKVIPWLDETTIYTSQAALDERQKELKHIIEVKMLENARAIGEAAAHGDLSENSEWKFALEERDLLAARARKMQDEIGRSHVIRHEDIPTDTVGIGSRVLLRRDDGDQLEMTFMGPWDSDLSSHVYAYQTPLAQDLMGKKVGDEVSCKLEGHEGTYRIEALGVAVAETLH
jgi:transcription elongation GreA/GreB family factor